ncbi:MULTISPECIES: hypothetical protein [Dickeya]|uniref:Mucin protein n=1 Tax=Dickeya oryzae TaxID=1240404 RepID=A0AB39IF79_9GAMM|nr:MULTISPECIES: hypothetical protein [Dickeya]MBP2851128.1 mucin protein [Dickeya oryzae]MBP2858597.1 mucin protein [Dickeya oryzae]MCA6995654.1 mucin protein [Dickeya oryzae]
MTSISQTGAYAATPSIVISSPKITITKSEETGGYHVNIDSKPDITNNQPASEEALRKAMAYFDAKKAGIEPPQSSHVTISEDGPITLVTYGDLLKKATSTDNPVTTTAGRVVYTPGTSSDGITIQSTPVTTSSEADTPTTQPS